jgi:hypothetical protein
LGIDGACAVSIRIDLEARNLFGLQIDLLICFPGGRLAALPQSGLEYWKHRARYKSNNLDLLILEFGSECCHGMRRTKTKLGHSQQRDSEQGSRRHQSHPVL